MFRAISMAVSDPKKTDLKRYLELALTIFLVVYFGSMAIEKIKK